jgi:hypothetical protein
MVLLLDLGRRWAAMRLASSLVSRLAAVRLRARTSQNVPLGFEPSG